ncbi:hypothetical protein DSO57_1029369, partial [Entomophthora muscae]
MATEPTTKNHRYLLEEITWEPLSNLVNAQEAVQLYLNKKNQKGGLLREKGDGVRIDNSSSLETQAQEWDSNPDPGFPWATGPMDQRAACPRFPEVDPPQADTKNVDPNAPNGGLTKALNGGNKISTISFMILKSTLATNQEPSSEGGPQPNPVTTTLKQYNQVANSRLLTNERTPSPGAILLP